MHDQEPVVVAEYVIPTNTPLPPSIEEEMRRALNRHYTGANEVEFFAEIPAELQRAQFQIGPAVVVPLTLELLSDGRSRIKGQEPPEQRCWTCRWWEQEEGKYPRSYGTCGATVDADTKESRRGNAALILPFGQDLPSTLRTPPEFGCVQWEGKADGENLSAM